MKVLISDAWIYFYITPQQEKLCSNVTGGFLEQCHRLIVRSSCSQMIYRSSHQRWSVKKAVLKNFAIFIGKHQCWSLFLIRLQAFRPATLSRKDSNTGVFLWYCEIFKNTYFDEHLRMATSGYMNKLVWKITQNSQENVSAGVIIF